MNTPSRFLELASDYTASMSSEKTPVNAPGVANPLPGVIPHAVKAGGLVFVSGSIGMDETNKVIEGGIREHTVESNDYLTRDIIATTLLTR